jgi:GNAT superfamily N-acetyltransferase
VTRNSASNRETGVQVGDGRTVDPGQLAKLIGGAFLPLEPCKYLVPEPSHRLLVMTRFFELDVRECQEDGSVDVTADHRGVALWMPRSGEPSTEPDPVEELKRATGKYLDRFLAFNEELVSHYPAGRAFEHLMILAVDPDAQRHGLGSALLTARHARLDAEGIPAYLEAASLALTGFYQRHGYERLDKPIVLPDGRQMHPMWREPRTP